jgi:hypothetical protein
VFPDADYADLFSPPGVGRPSLPATQMAAVLTWQALHDFRTGRTPRRSGSDPSSLVYWRRRPLTRDCARTRMRHVPRTSRNNPQNF